MSELSLERVVASFEALAVDFLALSKCKTDEDDLERYSFSELWSGLWDKAGEMIVRARQNGWRPVLDGFDEMIDFHSQPTPESTKRLGRTPGMGNLFLDVIDSLPEVPMFEFSAEGHSLKEVHGCKALAKLYGECQAPNRGSRRYRMVRPRRLTPRQTEVMHVVGECKGNISEAARQLGCDRRTVKRQHIAALKKLGATATDRPKVQGLPRDRRGQEHVSADDDRRR